MLQCDNQFSGIQISALPQDRNDCAFHLERQIYIYGEIYRYRLLHMYHYGMEISALLFSMCTTGTIRPHL